MTPRPSSSPSLPLRRDCQRSGGHRATRAEAHAGGPGDRPGLQRRRTGRRNHRRGAPGPRHAQRNQPRRPAERAVHHRLGRSSRQRQRIPPRRPPCGLALGYLTGAVGSLGVVLAAVLDNVPLLFAALFVYGAGTATNLQARYAGADLAPPSAEAAPSARCSLLQLWAQSSAPTCTW